MAVPLLTRHLGVADYGSYMVVVSLIAIATIFADAGLTAAGLSEYAVRDAEGRHSLLQNLVSARLVTSAVAGAGVVLFALVAGYQSVVVAGTALGVVGLVLTTTQQTYAIPLAAALRIELATALTLLRQTLAVAGVVVLVALGAGLLALFALPIPVAIIVLAATLLVVKSYGAIRPAVDRPEMRHLLAVMPAATASMLGALFYRVAIVVMSVMATAQETGYFGLSLQIVDVFTALAAMIGGTALPLLARAAEMDRQRLRSAFQQLFDVSVILGLGSAFVLVIGAKPIIAFVGGSEFAPAVAVLQIQGFAVALTFVVTLFVYMLWALRERRQLLAGNLAGVTLAIALTAALVPIAEAKGAAVAMLIAECAVCGWLGVALLRHAPDVRPSFGTLAKALIAVTAAFAVALVPMPRVVAVVVGVAVYILILLALRAIPRDIWHAIVGGMRSS